MKNPLALIVCIALPLAVGGTAGFYTVSEIGSWYSTLEKPWFNPPNWIFGPVWTTLYIVMGFSCWRIWNVSAGKARKSALIIYGIQLFLNFWWSILFFHFQQIGLALIEIVLLWISIVMMIVQFYKLDKPAGLLQIPYIMWVSFAGMLTAAIYSLN